jgi:hypothetical protein
VDGESLLPVDGRTQSPAIFKRHGEVSATAVPPQAIVTGVIGVAADRISTRTQLMRVLALLDQELPLVQSVFPSAFGFASFGTRMLPTLFW